MSTATAATASRIDIAQAPALLALLSLNADELLAHLPSILTSLHTQRLLQLPLTLSHPSTLPSPFTTSPSALYLRVERKALDALRPPPHSPSTPPSERPDAACFVGLHLLSGLIDQATPSSLQQGQAKRWMEALRSLLSATHLPRSLRLLAVECQVDLIRRARMRESLTPTLTEVLHLLHEEAAGGGEGGSHLRRALRLVEGLLLDFASSVKAEDRAALRPALLRLLEHRQEGVMELVASSLTLLHLALSSTTTSQRQRQQQQQKLQREAQDTVEETEERKRELPSDLAFTLSPYHLLCLQAVHSMRDCVNPIRLSFALSALPSTSMRLTELPSLPSSLLPYDHLLRYQRLITLLLALISPSSPSSPSPTELSFPLPLLLHTLCATLTMDAASAKDASTTVLILPDLYRSALTLLHEVVRGSVGWQVLGQAEEVAALLTDVHRRCSESVGMQSLLPLVYEVLASFFLLPLSPAVVGSLCRSLLSPLLDHVKQPLVVRQQLRQQSAQQRMSAQLLGPQQRKSAPHSHNNVLTDLLAPTQSLSDDIAASALSALHRLLYSLPFCAPTVRQPLRRLIDGALLVLALTLPSIDDAPVPLRCGVYRCMLQAVLGGGEAGVGGKPSALLVYALALFVEGAREGQPEDVRAMCQKAVLACEWLRAERVGAVGGKRRRQADAAAVMKAPECAPDGSHLMDGLDAFNAAAGVIRPPAPPTVPPSTQLALATAAARLEGSDSPAAREPQVRQTRGWSGLDELKAGVEQGRAEAGDDEAGEEDELDGAEEGEKGEVDRAAIDRRGEQRMEDEQKGVDRGEVQSEVRMMEVRGDWAEGEGEESEEEDVPLNLDEEPDVE